ncbi:MAG TPA: UDP-N-acetylmuramate--L-alanine ligase [Actinomycetota bacterium]|nr:UDP-N-acetylmuramate--L-alanine ligase [Actinomycetota bacterium]
MKTFEPRPGTIPTLQIPDLLIRRAHLVGVGGAGMSGIARLLLARGIAVSGSDLKDSPGLALLRGAGAEVTIGHRADNLGSADVVVVSTAIAPGNPEVVAARERGLPVLARAQVLAALMRERRGIAIAGTHGKTTTTSMAAVIFERAGLDPTYVVGGDLNESGSNARSGAGEYFVAEADESDGSFLLLDPEIAVVTNVEADHLDFYRDEEEVESAFTAFCRRADRVIACGDDPGVRRVLEAAAVRATTYGTAAGNDVRLEDVETSAIGARCVVVANGDRVELTLAIPGRHYLLNATGAMLAARAVGVSLETAARALRSFTGVRRRFESRGNARGASFIDDYAHHPTEISATLGAARSVEPARLVAVFQPHRFTRTEVLWRELGRSLADADLVVVTDVYGAGEMPVPGVTGKLLVEALLDRAPRARVVYLPSRADVGPFLAGEVREGDLVLTLGAGDVTMVADETLSRILETNGVG